MILAGGSGTRFWPLSRELSPKQFFRFVGTTSLIYQAIERVLPVVPEERTVVVTSERLQPEIHSHLMGEEEPFPHVAYLVEPASRNTAPAIGLTAAYLAAKDPEAIAIVLPSDHVVEAGEAFLSPIRTGIALAQAGYLATIGLRPTSPQTGFGYIKSAHQLEISGAELPAYQVDRFVEKPDHVTAAAYVASGEYYWNSGMFVFKCSVLLDAIKAQHPLLHETLTEIASAPQEEWLRNGTRERFASLEAISIDYAVMEGAGNVAVVPVDLKWNDVGSFTALEEFIEHDEAGNALIGNVVEVDSTGCLAYADKRLIALLGMEDIAVIDTQDATLVMPKERAQDVRKIVDVIKATGRQEHLAHRTSMRPWGSFTILEEGPGFKIKIIEVKVGGKLSHQLHHHRSEHWVVLTGTARVMRGVEEVILHPNQSTFIPASVEHRLENIGKIPLKIIEVQSGEYLSEDDIVRLSDVYER